MRRGAGVTLGAAVVMGFLATPTRAQDVAPTPGDYRRTAAADSVDASVQVFIDSARKATRRFESRTEAIRAGYRRLGPDFPGMGEHWIHPALVVRGTVEADSPPVLSYVEVEGEAVLVGLAYTLPLGPDDEPPASPFGREAWHDHSGAVDEETLLLNHPASAHGGGGGHRLSMVHVWTGLANPDGILAQNNWRLPFLRLGLIPPADPGMNDARGASLAHGGRDFYRLLLDRAADLSDAESRVVSGALEEAAARAEATVGAARDLGGRVEDPGAFGRIWADFWAEVRDEVRPETWRMLEGLAGTAAGHH